MSPTLRNILSGAASVRLTTHPSLAGYSQKEVQARIARAEARAQELGLTADEVLRTEFRQRMVGQLGYTALCLGLMGLACFGVSQHWPTPLLMVLAGTPGVLAIAVAVMASRTELH